MYPHLNQYPLSPYHLLPHPTLKVQLLPGYVHVAWLLLTRSTLSHALFNCSPVPVLSLVFSLRYHLIIDSLLSTVSY